MANLVEVAQWEEGIYQFETSDPVLGGPDGIDNRQAKQLGNRTLYLKQQLERAQTGLDGHVGVNDPHSQYAQKAGATFTGPLNVPMPPIGDNSSLAAPTAWVAATIAALVNSAPGTLDTLKELADALGDDANFATTVANTLATKAPLKSPRFEDTPTAPTGTLGDSSDQVATNRFVQQAIGAGHIAFFARGTPPAGYLKANGAAVSRTTYAALFDAIGMTFGAGDGSTTFNLPDLRGEFVRGWDDARGADIGRVFGSWQHDLFRAHNHRFINEYYTPSDTLVAWSDGNNEGVDVAVISGSRAHTYLWLENTGGAETRPRNVALLACIKY